MWSAAGILGVLGTGALLILDSMCYGYGAADPILGRSGGCFTQLERWLKVARPSEIRTVELVLGILLACSPLVLLVRRATRSRTARRIEE